MPVFKLSSPLPPSLPSLPPSLPPFLPVEESLPLEHGVKLAPDPLPGLLDRRAVAHEGQGHLREGGREGGGEGGREEGRVGCGSVDGRSAFDPLPGLLDRRAVAHKGQGHLRGGGREGRREGGVSMSEGEGGREGKGVPSSP